MMQIKSIGMLQKFCGLVFLYFLSMPQIGRTQEDMRQLRSLWQQGNYSDVFKLLKQYRDGLYGRNLEVDYMIATSACRLNNVQQEGNKFFQWILSHYSLDNTSRSLVEREMHNCAPSRRPTKIAFVTVKTGAGAAGVRGKTYHWPDAENAAISNDPAKVIREIPIEAFHRRLFPKSERSNGIAHIKSLIDSKYKVTSNHSFIFATASGHSDAELLTIGTGLEKYLSFFNRQYEIPLPSHLITIYLVPSTWELQQLAEKVHGIKVSESSIGYSFRDDLSMVGWVTGTGYGTLAHELFHLMVRSHFGDIPPWMDEGIAALYEVSKIRGNAIIGLPNWRGSVLKRYWDNRPFLWDLVAMDWRSFDNEEGDYEATQQATNHAMARYFVLYLQTKGKLFEVYHAFHHRKVEEMLIDPGTDAIRLLESILGKSIQEIDQDFARYFLSLQISNDDDTNVPAVASENNHESKEEISTNVPPSTNAPVQQSMQPGLSSFTNRAEWKKQKSSYWFYLNGQSLKKPVDFLDCWVGEDLLIYVFTTKQYYVLKNFNQQVDDKLSTAEYIASPNQTLWKKHGNGYWFFYNGVSLKKPTDFDDSWSGDDVQVHVKKDNKYFLLKDFDKTDDYHFKPAETAYR